MENTSQFLFDNRDEKYFLAIGGKGVGPMTAQEIYERIQKGEAGLLSYIWRDGWSDWKRVCDEKDFAVLVPQKPAASSIGAIREKMEKRTKTKTIAPPPAPDEEKKYYLYDKGGQFGPFSRAEFEHALSSQKVGRMAYLWMQGMATWKRVSEVAEFAKFLGAAQELTKEKIKGTPAVAELARRRGSNEKTSDKRGAPRRPLVARLFLHNNEDVIVAVCRDISIGGMQVLTDRVPGTVGSIVKLNVSPGDGAKVKGFVAEGEIVRVLEDGRGFSFRFTKLTADAKSAIQKYITE